MRLRGSKRFGITLAYGTLRVANLDEEAVENALKSFRNPDVITVSRKNEESEEKDTLEEAVSRLDELHTRLGLFYNRRPKRR